MVAHLEMSPLIDTMASLTVMLFAMMACWGASSVPFELPHYTFVHQGCGGDPPPPSVLPLTLHFAASHVWFGRRGDSGLRVPRVEGAADFALLDAMLVFDRFLYPAERVVILNVDHGVTYGDVLPMIERTRIHGYDLPLLVGGPAFPEG